MRLLVLLSEFGHDPLADQVQHQGHEEKHQRNGEQAVVVDGIVRKVAAADAGDVGGHRFSGFERIEGEFGCCAGGDRHDHRLADRAGDPDDDGRADARKRRRDDDLDAGSKGVAPMA
jgi:hypothetical protein